MPSDFEGKEIRKPSPETMRKELEKFLEHLLSHDPEAMRFVMIVAGHAQEQQREGAPDTHVCSMVGGPPAILVQMLTELADEIVARNPEFAFYFFLSALQRLRKLGSVQTQLAKFDDLGGDEAKAKLDELLAKFMNNTPPEGGIH